MADDNVSAGKGTDRTTTGATSCACRTNASYPSMVSATRASRRTPVRWCRLHHTKPQSTSPSRATIASGARRAGHSTRRRTCLKQRTTILDLLGQPVSRRRPQRHRTELELCANSHGEGLRHGNRRAQELAGGASPVALNMLGTYFASDANGVADSGETCCSKCLDAGHRLVFVGHVSTAAEKSLAAGESLFALRHPLVQAGYIAASAT
jgi:hypothetical protein